MLAEARTAAESGSRPETVRETVGSAFCIYVIALRGMERRIANPLCVHVRSI